MGISACSGGQAHQVFAPNAAVDPAAEYLTDYVPGGTLSVASMGTPLAFSDGRSAQKVAAGFCANRHARLNPAAFGHFNAGAWDFKKACI